MSRRIIELDASREGAWREYAGRHPSASFFHQLEWRDLLRSTFRHRTHYLMSLDDSGKTTGILPLVSLKSLLFGRSVVSVPFGVYGGLVADEPESTRALLDAASLLGRDIGSTYVELRQQKVAPGLELPGTDLYCTFERDLPADASQCLELLPRKARAEARKASTNPDLRIEAGEIKLDEFYRLFAINKRKLGSPVFPKSLFWNLRRIYGDRMVALTVKRNGVALASVLSFLFRDTYMAYYSGATDDANEFSANNLMYHAAMKDAVERGLRRFDFGRSRRETGAFNFKKNQGFEPTPLHYQYILENGASLPNFNASNPRYDLAKKIFKKLPFFVAEKLGSYIVKRMPV